MASRLMTARYSSRCTHPACTQPTIKKGDSILWNGVEARHASCMTPKDKEAQEQEAHFKSAEREDRMTMYGGQEDYY